MVSEKSSEASHFPVDRMRRADDRDRPDRPRVEYGGRPADQSAVGMAHQCRGIVAECPYQPGGVTCQGPTVITARWLVAAAVTTQIHSHHPSAGQAAQLVAPRPPERSETVQQDDQGAV